MEKLSTRKNKTMLNLIGKLIIFTPICFAVFTTLVYFKNDTQGYVVLFFTISCFIAIAFYYTVIFLIEDRTNTTYMGCIINLQNKKFHCFCGSDATMFLAENESNETRVIIQCDRKDCGTSVQGDSINRAERGWEAICH